MAVTGGADAGTPPHVDRELIEADNGSVHPVKVGDVVSLVLETSATSGFVWTTTSADGLEPAAEPKVETAGGGAGRRAGGNARTVFLFKVARGGQISLSLAHHRPWETDVHPSRTFDVTLTAD